MGHTQNNQISQQWECALDLHQGDKGTLSLNRARDTVEGIIRINRNDSVFESEVEGDWFDNYLNMERIFESDENEPMSGLILALKSDRMKIGGRFSTEFQGVWSADCDLVSTINLAADNIDSGPFPPSTSTRVSPSDPSTKDKLKFSAVATHPEGIKSITFYVNNKNIKSCESSACEVDYGPLSAGSYTWRVEAVSESGIKSAESIDEFVVIDNQAKGTCTIQGAAIGYAADRASDFSIKLYGPNNKRIFRESTKFSNERYKFSQLPEGSYQIKIDMGDDQSVISTPSIATVTCTEKATINQSFDLH